MNLLQLRNQWMPISLVKKISTRPQRFVLLNRPLVIFRIKEKIIALQDFCPHRGMPLSAGKVGLDDGLLQCAYHGWRFNTLGECVDIPGLTAFNCTNKKVPAYPTQVHLGLVFICLDKNENTLPLYNIPALQTQDYDAHLIKFKLQGDVVNILENVLDATHTHFVHTGLIRHNKQRQAVTATLNVNNVSAEICYENEPKQPGWISSIFETDRKFSIGRFHLPLIAELEYHGFEHLTLAFTFFLSPSFNDEHQVFLLLSYRKTWVNRIKKLFFLPFIKLAFKQDKTILKKQAINCASFPEKQFQFKSTQLDIIRPHIKRLLAGKSVEYHKVFTLNL